MGYIKCTHKRNQSSTDNVEGHICQSVFTSYIEPFYREFIGHELKLAIYSVGLGWCWLVTIGDVASNLLSKLGG